MDSLTGQWSRESQCLEPRFLYAQSKNRHTSLLVFLAEIPNKFNKVKKTRISLKVHKVMLTEISKFHAEHWVYGLINEIWCKLYQYLKLNSEIFVYLKHLPIHFIRSENNIPWKPGLGTMRVDSNFFRWWITSKPTPESIPVKCYVIIWGLSW